jgi:hypothetical protein
LQWDRGSCMGAFHGCHVHHGGRLMRTVNFRAGGAEFSGFP